MACDIHEIYMQIGIRPIESFTNKSKKYEIKTESPVIAGRTLDACFLRFASKSEQ